METYRWLFNTISDWAAWVVIGGLAYSYVKVRRELDALKEKVGHGRREAEKKQREVVSID